MNYRHCARCLLFACTIALTQSGHAQADSAQAELSDHTDQAASPVLAESVGFSWRGGQAFKDSDYHQSEGIEVAVSEGEHAGSCLSIRVTKPPEGLSYTEVDLLKYDPPRAFTGSLVGRYRYRGPTHSFLIVDIQTADGGRFPLDVMLQPLPGFPDAWQEFRIPLSNNPASPVKVCTVIADLSYGAEVEFGPMVFTEKTSFQWPFPLPQEPVWASEEAPAEHVDGEVVAHDGHLGPRRVISTADVRTPGRNWLVMDAWRVSIAHLTPGHYVLRANLSHGGLVQLVEHVSLLIGFEDDSTPVDSGWLGGPQVITRSERGEVLEVEMPFEITTDRLAGDPNVTVYLWASGCDVTVDIESMWIERRLGKGEMALVVRRSSLLGPLSGPVVPWWSDRQAGLIGGIGGSVFGCLGALIGIVGGRGKARRFVLAMLWGMAAFGAVSLAGGVAALVCSQPYHVYYPLLLGGGIMMIISLVVIPTVKRRYAQIELRKMSAMDAS